MDCIARACKHNKEGVCSKFKDANEFLDALKRGGGCAISWFFTGKLPSMEVK